MKLNPMTSLRGLIKLLMSFAFVMSLVIVSAPNVSAPPLGCPPDDTVTKTFGGITVNTHFIHPTTPRVVLLSGSSPASDQITIRVEVFDDCTGAMVGEGMVEVEFAGIYAQYGQRVAPGDIITVPKRYGNLAGTAVYLGSPIFGESQKAFRRHIGYYTVFDFLLENIWLFVLVILALMSYRFFTSRRIDFYELWQEFKGKR